LWLVVSFASLSGVGETVRAGHRVPQALGLDPSDPPASVPLADPADAWTSMPPGGAGARYLHTAVWTGSRLIVWGGQVTNTGVVFNPATGLWSQMSTINEPEKRYGHTAVWTGSRMIVWGGTRSTGSGQLNTGGSYDPSTDTWTPMSTVNAPAARTSHVAVWSGTHLIVWGGHVGNPSSPESTGGKYDPVTDTWTSVSTTNVPSPRSLPTAVWTGTRMIVWGGYDPSSNTVATGASYDPSADQWTATPMTNAPSARGSHTAVWTGTRMLVWGGAGSTWLNTGASYEPVSGTWTALTTNSAPTPRQFQSAVWTGTRMIVWGGIGAAGYTATGGIYDPGSDSWTTPSVTNSPAARRDNTATWTDARLIVVGGYANGTSTYFADTRGYDPTTDTWVESTTSVPAPRTDHSTVWTGTRMIVWGGYSDDGSALGSGGRYDPATNTWSPTSATNAPSARLRHTAVWTGSRMIVWGGAATTTGGAVSTGAIYDPVADRWTPTSTIGAPSARYQHSAVWTGSRMIVWGGRLTYEPFAVEVNTGASYDPGTDTWTAISTTGAPFGRSSHTAIWTGSQMVVWGGNTCTESDTGGRYDPASDTWQATSLTNAPVRRTLHTGVWTGSRMIVWGGMTGGNFCPGSGPRIVTFLNTGASYDPVGDAWTPISTTNAPQARDFHSAVWTGAKMIVWGGYTGFGTGPTGGGYDPGADTWTATPLANAPAARERHSAVWTGSSMIVWGGGGPGGGGRIDTGGVLAARSVSVTDAAIAEGGSAQSILAFTVSLSAVSPVPVTMTYTTSDGTAAAGSDYVSVSGILTIPAGVTSKNVVVLVNSDTSLEPDETITLTLSNATNATIVGGTATAVGTIVNDDAPAAATTITQYRLYHEGTKEHLYTTDQNEYNVLGTRGWAQEGVAYRMLTNGIHGGVATVPLFRLYHPGILQHHWTTDSNEAVVLSQRPEWFYEGTVGYVVSTQVPGTVALYRMNLPYPPLHLWTTDLNEYTVLQTRGWIAEGIIGYVVP
jgi:N-acetylneuraminic acid mutarotase